MRNLTRRYGSHNQQCITREGNGRAVTNAYIDGGALGSDGKPLDMGSDIFARGLCLPSDNKMTPEQLDRIIEVVRKCLCKTKFQIDLKRS